MRFMGKTVDGRNLKQMIRVTKGLCLYKIADPKGLSKRLSNMLNFMKRFLIFPTLLTIDKDRILFQESQSKKVITYVEL